jgi:spermidine/putrescine-binding protein
MFEDQDGELAGLTRAQFLRRAASAGVVVVTAPVLAAWGSSGPASGSDTIERGTVVKLYNWQGYDDKANLKAFNGRYGVNVRPTYIAGDQEVFTKLGAQKGQGQWDVLTYNSGLVPQLYAQGILEPLKPAEFSSAASIYPEFMGLPQIKAGSSGDVVGLPFSWGYQGFIRTGKLPELRNWDEIFDPRLKGQLIGVNDPTTSIATMALALGFRDYDTLTHAQLDEVMDGWERLRPSLRTITPDYGVAKDLLVRGEVQGCVPGWQAMVVNAAHDGVRLFHDIPVQGVYGFLDLLCIIKGTKNPAGAKALVDFMLAPRPQAQLAKSLSQGITNEKAVPLLPKVLQETYQYDSLAQNFARSPIRPLPSGSGGEYVTFADWAEAWERFTAG